MESDKRKWHIDKGVPVALILSMASALFLGGAAYQALKSEISKNAESTSEMRAEVKEMKAELRALSVKFTDTSVPSALNSRRLDDLERGIGTLQSQLTQAVTDYRRLELRVVDNERRLSGEAARNRAAKER